jgi:hypothetical protein
VVSAPTILPLICPACGEALRGLDQDVIFWCQGCRSAVEVAGETFLPRPAGTAAVVDRSRRPALHLPIWAFRVQGRYDWPDPEREARASLIPPLPWVYVTGFSLQNPSYFGDPGLVFTERRVDVRAADDQAPLLGCVRGLEAASAFVEAHLLTILDRRVDVTDLRLTCIIEEARLWSVPFFETGEGLEDGILGLRLPAGVVNDLAALRAALKPR